MNGLGADSHFLSDVAKMARNLSILCVCCWLNSPAYLDEPHIPLGRFEWLQFVSASTSSRVSPVISLPAFAACRCHSVLAVAKPWRRIRMGLRCIDQEEVEVDR